MCTRWFCQAIWNQVGHMKYLGHYLAGATVGLVQGSPVCLHLPVTLRWYGSPGLKWAPGGITSVCVCACVCGVRARARVNVHTCTHIQQCLSCPRQVQSLGRASQYAYACGISFLVWFLGVKWGLGRLSQCESLQWHPGYSGPE